MRVFEYVVFTEPKKDGDGNTTDTGQLIVPISSILAEDEGQAQIIAARSIPEEHMSTLDRVVVAIRPFDGADVEQTTPIPTSDSWGQVGAYTRDFARTAQTTYTAANTINFG